MHVSIGFIGVDPIEPTLELVRLAEACGLDGVESAEHVSLHDAVVPSALYLRETTHIEVGMVGLNAGSRHPALLAMELASLAELGPGRVRATVGTGSPQLMAQIGADMSHPIPRVRSLVEALRALHSGEQLSGESPAGAFDGFRLLSYDGSGLVPYAESSVPIDVMAIRPRMLRLAAQIGDGVALTSGASVEYLTNTVRTLESELAAAGRDRAAFRITASAYAVITPKADQLVEKLLVILARYPAEEAALIMSGALDGEAYIRAASENPVLAAKTFLTPEVVQRVAMLASDPTDLLPLLGRYADTGVDALNIHLVGPLETRAYAVEAIAAARKNLPLERE